MAGPFKQLVKALDRRANRSHAPSRAFTVSETPTGQGDFILPTEVVRRLNGLMGNVDLVEGSNVTVTVSGQEIAIAVTIPDLPQSKIIDLTFQATAGTGGVNAFQVVYIAADNTILAADATNQSHAGRIAGIATENILESEAGVVQKVGVVRNPAWMLTPGAAYFLGQGGEVTTTVPSAGFIQRIGVAKDANTLSLLFGEPILII